MSQVSFVKSQVRASLCVAIGIALLGNSAMASTPSVTGKTVAGEASVSMVTLMIKRSSNTGDFTWDRLTVPATELDAKMVELLSDPDVIRVEPDRRVSIPEPVVTPQGASAQSQRSQAEGGLLFNDPHYDQQRYFTEGDVFNSEFEPAHKRLNSTATVRVGIIDSGFFRAADLTYAEGANFVSPRGSAFINGEGGICPGGGIEHGSDVSHMVGAISNNFVGIAGIGRNVELVAARALDCNGNGFSIDIVDAVRWLAGDDVDGVPSISEPVDVINMSLSGQGACFSFEQDAFDYATSRGIAVVIAAGNNGLNALDYSPGNCDRVITVGSTDENGRLSPFSNAGPNVAIAAQGSLTMSAAPNGDSRLVNGTSFASPTVAGAVALVLGERPDTTAAQMSAYIAQSGKPVNGSVAQGLGAGILDAMKLMDAAGIPREVVAVRAALQGDAGRFEEALTHPKANAYITQTRGVGLCELAEVDARVMPNAQDNDPLYVFAVPANTPLDPLSINASEIALTSDDRILIDTSELGKSLDYGMSKCDLVSGDNCNQVDTIRALDFSSLEGPAFCRTQRAVAVR